MTARALATNSHDSYPSTLESVATARRAVGVYARSCGFSAMGVSDIVLAVGEACSNVVEHASAAHADFMVRCSFVRGVFSVEVSDRGRGFDERHVNTGLIPAEFIGRGRGIPIMRAVMDSVRYDVTNAGTTVRLEKRLAASGVGESAPESSRVYTGDRSQPR